MLRYVRVPAFVKAAWQARSPDGRRAIPVNLALFFVFALTALVLLARTVVSAEAASDNVTAAVNPVTKGIDSNLAMLAKLGETAGVTGRIAASATHFPGDLATAAAALKAGTAAAVGINASAKTIRTSVDGIDATTVALPQSSAVLGVNAAGIRNEAADIATRFDAVQSQTHSMVRDLTASNRSLTDILAVLGPLGTATSEIDQDLRSINVHTGNMAGNPLIALGNLPNDLLGGPK